MCKKPYKFKRLTIMCKKSYNSKSYNFKCIKNCITLNRKIHKCVKLALSFYFTRIYFQLIS